MEWGCCKQNFDGSDSVVPVSSCRRASYAVECLPADLGAPLSGRDTAGSLDAATELRPHLILCDMNLPDMKGTELIRELNSRRTATRAHAVIVTAKSATDIEAYNRIAAKLGVERFVPKPIEPETIRTLLSELELRELDSRGSGS